MLIFHNIDKIQQFVSRQRDSGKSTGFVPTMGALHEGHLSLFRCCKAQNEVSIVSIFVNPAQFNDANDYRNYPRDVNHDIQKMENEGIDIAFIPSEKEMYPHPGGKEYNFGYLETIMEGRFRPGHFNGVALAVHRLFDIITPDRAYFGEKDYQQLVIIRQLVKELSLPVEIVACPTVREESGLAMSSRNGLLEPEDRKRASVIFKTLKQAAGLWNSHNIEQIKQWVRDTISREEGFNLEYFEIADANDLKIIKSRDEANRRVACIALYFKGVRLIDNIIF